MPDKYGKLSGDDMQQVIDHIRYKLGDETCPMCRCMDLGIGPNLGMIPSFEEREADEEFSPLASYPVVLTTCPECGYTRMFMATIVGIVPRPEPGRGFLEA
jgi:predicted nucleic-acid-binding Zn-ribbon protein